MRTAVAATALLAGGSLGAFQPAHVPVRGADACGAHASIASRLQTPSCGGSAEAWPLCSLPQSRSAVLMHADAQSQQQLQQPQQAQLQLQLQQQQQQPVRHFAHNTPVARGALAVLTSLALTFGGDVRMASAENELAVLAGSKSTAELVKPECFANSCKSQMESCAADGDCMKGLLCTAKCMGDAQCTVGCFARYNDASLERVLQCTIEDAGCIAIATQAPGPDSATDAPLPPKALVKATPKSLQGRWYKVLGFNPNYDCFDCQRNSFQASGAGAGGARDGQMSSQQVSMDIGPSQAAVEVEYAMPRARIGAPMETFHATLNEKLEFDTDPKSVRTAHTEGRMFGLTFWENWYLIGQNQPRETEYRFVYYTGKTLQNRYEGAFVYARKPELPQSAMPSIYKTAREAGLDPTRACCIDNSCFSAPVEAAQPPPFTPVASAETLSEDPAVSMTQLASPSSAASGPLDALTRPMRTAARDLAELLEDPRPPAADLFAKQRPMSEVREFDANGFRRPISEMRN